MNKAVKVILWILFALFEIAVILLGIASFGIDNPGAGMACILLAVGSACYIYYRKAHPENFTKEAKEARAAKRLVEKEKNEQAIADAKNAWKDVKTSFNVNPSKLQDREELQKRIAENRRNGIACCPKCGSTSLSANKKGFGVGKAVIGAAATGGIGLVAGNINAKKVRITCLNCGYQWFAGEK